jgi:ssDNA thymidine ADP-ribosyltransferase, DarT
MSGINYLDGSIYHMAHFENLKDIFQRRAILSKEKVLASSIRHRSIAFEDVQSLRDRVYVWDISEQRIRPLHSYVPFYFGTLTPMLYVQYKNGIQDEIIFFEVSRSIIRDNGVLFTDGNASNQQLARNSSEQVLISPATSSIPFCYREYSTEVPYGTNPNCSNFYSDPIFLERLNWNTINDHWFIEGEKKRIKHAEVLVPDIVPLGRVQGIYARTQEMARTVNALIKACGLTGRIPTVIAKPELYFYQRPV